MESSFLWEMEKTKFLSQLIREVQIWINKSGHVYIIYVIAIIFLRN